MTRRKASRRRMPIVFSALGPPPITNRKRDRRAAPPAGMILPEKIPHLLLEKPCAVTAYSMKLKLMQDGRDRGLWVCLSDTERSESNRDQVSQTINKLLEEFDLGPLEMLKFTLRFHHMFEDLLKKQIQESALLEWPAIEELHTEIGEELRRKKKADVTR